MGHVKESVEWLHPSSGRRKPYLRGNSDARIPMRISTEPVLFLEEDTLYNGHANALTYEIKFAFSTDIVSDNKCCDKAPENRGR